MPRPSARAKVIEDAKRRGRVLNSSKMGFVPDSYSNDPEADEKIKSGTYQKNTYSDTKLPSAAFAYENFHEIDEDDVRLDRYSVYARGGKGRDGRNKKDANIQLQKDPSRGRKVLDVLDDSPNGHNLNMGAPREFEEKVKFYSKKLKVFTLDYPEEFGVLHYKLGKIFYTEFMICKDNEKILNNLNSTLTFEEIADMSASKIKNLENAIFHFSKAREVFLEDSHPLMFCIISMLLSQCFRYRIHIMTYNVQAPARASVQQMSSRGASALECSRRAQSILAEAQSVYQLLISSVQSSLPTTLESNVSAKNKPLPVQLQYTVECAICNLELGWMYYINHELLNSDGKEEEFDDSLSELAIISLERALDLSQSVSLLDETSLKPFRDPNKFPDYIKLLNSNKSFDRLEGNIYYVLGRIYQDLGYNIRNIKNSISLLGQSYEYYCTAVKAQYLGAFIDSLEWGDCHHRIAAMVIRDPALVNPEATEQGVDADLLHYDIAISHLKLCLRCLLLGKARFMDIHFHIANCLVAKLNNLIDKSSGSSGNGVSITKALSESESMEIMSQSNHHLHECLKRITPASTQSTQDAYVYYFSCLKLAEIRMLEAAAKKDISIQKRDKLFLEAIGYVVDSLQSRTLADNFDLHYVAAKQLVQMISAAKKTFTACRGYSKLLTIISCLINRLPFLESKNNKNFDATCDILLVEMSRQINNMLQASDRLTRWKKTHIGPLLLTESVTKGYAIWSFEQEIVPDVDIEKKDKEAKSTEDLPKNSNGKPNPKPPTDLPPPTHRKIATNSLGMNTTLSSLGKKSNGVKPETQAAPESNEFDRPMGVVPLAAMGQNPEFNLVMHYLNIHRDTLLRYSNAEISGDEIDISHSTLATPEESHKRSIWRDNIYLVPQVEDRITRTPLEAVAAIAEVKPLILGAKAKATKKEDESSDGSEGNESSEEDDEDVEEYVSSDEDVKKKQKANKTMQKYQPTSSIYFNNTQKVKNDKELNKHSDALSESTKNMKVGTKGQHESLKSLKSAAEGTPKKQKSGFFSKIFSGIGTKIESSINILDKKERDEKRLLKMKLIKEAKKANLYASLSAYYCTVVMSRFHRLSIQGRSSELCLFLGERMRYLFQQFKPELREKYRYFIKEIKTTAQSENGYLTPFLNLRELSQRPFSDLKSIFVNHSKTYRLIAEFETFLRTEVMLEDQFLPMVHASQTITRDISEFDRLFLDQNRLILTLGVEDEFRKAGDDLDEKKRASEAQDDDTIFDSGPQSREKSFQLKGGVNESLNMKKSVVNNRSVNNLKPKAKIEDPMIKNALNRHFLKADSMKMSYEMCHLLDGTSMEGGIREMVQKFLDIDEAIISFNVPSNNSNIEVLLIWREEVDDKDKASRQMTGDPDIDNIPKPPHIVIELVKSDLDTNTLNYLLKSWLEAIATRPNAKRLPRCTDVLHSMSCAFSMTELVKRLPLNIDTLMICYNAGPLALVPWNLLLIEVISPKISVDDSSVNQTSTSVDGHQVTVLSANEVLNGLGLGTNSKLTGNQSGKLLLSVTSEHLIDRFTVLVGPSLSHFELNSNYNSKLKHVSGLHKMVLIDGDTPYSNKAKESTGPTTPVKSSFRGKLHVDALHNSQNADFAGGVRATQLEVGGVASVWSADVQDHRLLMGSHASLSNLKSKAERDKKRRRKKNMTFSERQKMLEKEIMKENERASRVIPGVTDEEFKIGLAARDMDDISTDESEDSDEEKEKDEDRKSLFTCRVLHISSFKHDLDAQNDTGIMLPTISSESEVDTRRKKNQHKDFPLKFSSSFKNLKNDLLNGPKDHMSARDVVNQLYLPNCALCVLSRFSLCDDILEPNLVDPSLAFLDSFFLAGATTLIYPLWNGISMGHGSLAHQLLLLHFYSNLPSFASEKRSVAKTMRKSMFWLKASTADDIIAFVSRLPTGKAVKNRLIDEMESYVAASLSPTKQSAHEGLPSQEPGENDTKGNRVGGNRKFFTHFINWAFFVVAGHGGNVHHPDLLQGEGVLHQQHDVKTAKKISKLAANVSIIPDDAANVHKSIVDLEPDNPEFEYELLMSEGKIEEAKQLKEAMKQKQWKKFNDKIQYVTTATKMATQAIADSLDAVDKTFLDQDSDEIELSDEDKKKKKKEKELLPENRGFAAFLKSKNVQQNHQKVDPLERVKYHFGYGDQGPGSKLVPNAPNVEIPSNRGHTLKHPGVSELNSNDNDPSNWDKYSSPRAEQEKEKYDKKVKFGKEIDLNGSTASTWVKVGEELKPKEETYSDVEEDSEEKSDSDASELSDEGLKDRLQKTGKSSFKKIHKQLTSIKKEVRSYDEAQRVAQEMIKNIPTTNLIPEFVKRKPAAKIFSADMKSSDVSNDKIAEMTTKKEECVIC